MLVDKKNKDCLKSGKDASVLLFLQKHDLCGFKYHEG